MKRTHNTFRVRPGLCSVVLAVILLIATSGLFVIPLYCQTAPQTPQPADNGSPSESPTTTLHVTREPASPERAKRAAEELVDIGSVIFVRMAEDQAIRNVLPSIRRNLSDEDLVLFQTVIVRSVRPLWEVNARSDYDMLAGQPRMSLTTGLYRYLDMMVAGEVMSRELKARPCGDSYNKYLIGMLKKEVVAQKNGADGKILSYYEIQEPAIFASNHPESCPKIDVKQTVYDHSGTGSASEEWISQYQTAVGASLAFVILHEFAHIKYGDIYPANQISEPSPEQRRRLQRQRETRADDYAIQIFNKAKWNPLSALPIMALLAALEDYEVGQSFYNDYPSSYSRVSDLFSSAEILQKNKEFKKWLKKQGPQTVHDGEQFKALLNGQLN